MFPSVSLTFCSYGYRGRDCRANVYLLPTGEIVYFIASVVILFNYEERTQRHYLGHTDCVKWWESRDCCASLRLAGLCWHCLFASLAIHPDKIRIATGQIAGVDKDGRVRTEKWFTSSLLSSANGKNGKHIYNVIQSFNYQYLIMSIFNDLRRCSRTLGSGTASLCPPCRLSALVHLSEASALWLFLKLWVPRCILGTAVTGGILFT